MGLKKWIVMPGIVSYNTSNLVKLDLEFVRIQTWGRGGMYLCVPSEMVC